MINFLPEREWPGSLAKGQSALLVKELTLLTFLTSVISSGFTLSGPG